MTRPSPLPVPSRHPDLLRKTPRQARADQTLRILYEATAQILESEGLDGLTTNRVAEHAGYAVGTVYQYFRNKESLLLAMAMHEVEGVALATGRLMEAAQDQPLHATLRAVVQIWLDTFASRQRVQRLLMQAVMDNAAFPQFHRRVADMAGELGERLAALPLPDVQGLSASARFVLTRALVGVIRAGVLEDSPLLCQRELEDELVHLLHSRLTTPPAACTVSENAPVSGAS